MSKKKDEEVALVKTETAAVTEYDPTEYDADDGMDGLDESDLIVPRVHVVQQASSQRKEDGGEEGHLFNSLTKTNDERLRIIPLQVKAQRSNFPEGADRPICASDDGVAPSPRIDHPIHHVCCEIQGRRRVPVCPDAQWGEDHEPPACSGYYELLALSEEDQVPFLLSLRGLNVKPCKALISSAKLRRLPLRAQSCEVAVSKVTAKNNTIYVVRFGAYQMLDGIMRKAADDAYASLRGAVEATQQAEEAVSPSAQVDDDLAF